MESERLSIPEAIRKRPAMYVGRLGAAAVEHMVSELVSNVIDLFLGRTAGSVSIQLEGDEIVVTDDGPGFPFDRKGSSSEVSFGEYVVTHYHNKATADEHSPHVHLNFVGVGLAVVNALSKNFSVDTCKEGIRWKLQSRFGVLDSGITNEKTSKPNGTIIKFTPDESVLGSKTPRHEQLRSMLFNCVHLFPGFQVHFCNEIFHARGGLRDIIPFYSMQGSDVAFSDSLDPFYLNERTDKFSIQVAVLGNNEKAGYVGSWVNGVVTSQGGSHVDGVKEALETVQWQPSVILVSYIANEVRYAGSTKRQLIDPGVVPLIAQLLNAPLEEHIGRKLKLDNRWL